eukprot:COSAG04_NODE_3459_length_2796_cov_3.799407_1_plen_122_part_10
MRGAVARVVASWRLGSTSARHSRSVSRGAPPSWRRATPAVTAVAASAAAGATALLAGDEARAEGGSGLGATLDSIERRLARIEATLAPPAWDPEDDEGPETILNWSATHSVETKRLHQPESL